MNFSLTELTFVGLRQDSIWDSRGEFYKERVNLFLSTPLYHKIKVGFLWPSSFEISQRIAIETMANKK